MFVVIGLILQVATFTHYVTPNGSATSNCTQADPCSLTRVAGLMLPAGSRVLIQYGTNGVYSQGLLEFKARGTTEAPITYTMEEGVKVSGTRLELAQSAWTLVPGKSSTYQAVLDEAVIGFTAGYAAQRDPASWRTIRMDDRVPPFTNSVGRIFNLDFPILYRNNATLDLVEAQSCSMRHDTTANRVYVNMCHGGPPLDEDNLFLSPFGWGGILISGAHLVFENWTQEHSHGSVGGFKVANGTVGIKIRNFIGRATYVWLEGINTVFEDFSVGYYTIPGPPTHRECYDSNPEFLRGECWNANGEGRALLIGREGRATVYNQIIRRGYVHRSWNGGRIDGPNLMEDVTFWGFPNHTLEGSGNNVTLRGNTFHNGQDSIFLAREPFNNWIVENNLIYNSVMFMITHNTTTPIPPPTSLIFKNNVLSSMTVDEPVASGLRATCNVYIPGSAANTWQYKIIGTTTTRNLVLSAAQAAGYETGSHILPYTKWYDGSLFTQFTGQGNPNFDFTLVDPRGLAVCAPNAGPARFTVVP